MVWVPLLSQQFEVWGGREWAGELVYKGETMRQRPLGVEKREEEMAGTWEEPERVEDRSEQRGQ
jgi:hypothetical protein